MIKEIIKEVEKYGYNTFEGMYCFIGSSSKAEKCEKLVDFEKYLIGYEICLTYSNREGDVVSILFFRDDNGSVKASICKGLCGDEYLKWFFENRKKHLAFE